MSSEYQGFSPTYKQETRSNDPNFTPKKYLNLLSYYGCQWIILIFEAGLLGNKNF